MAARSFELRPATISWRPVGGYGGVYEVSDCGLVRSVARGALLRECTLKRGGYRAVSLWRGNRGHTFSVHRLVAFAFLGDPPPHHEVNHIDGDKGHNAAVNLEWVTRKRNIRHAIDTGLMPRVGAENPAAKITAATVLAVRAEYERGARQCAIAREHGLTPSHVLLIVTRRIWRHL